MSEIGDKIKATLRAGGIPVETVDSYGAQVVVTCTSEETARRVTHVLSMATFKPRGIVQSSEDLTDSGIAARHKRHAVRIHNIRPVWRAFFTV